MVAAMLWRSLLLGTLLAACGSPSPKPARHAGWHAVPGPRPPVATREVEVSVTPAGVVAQADAGPVHLSGDPSSIRWDDGRFATRAGPLIAITPVRGRPYLVKGPLPGTPLADLPHQGDTWRLQTSKQPLPSSPAWTGSQAPPGAVAVGHPATDAEQATWQRALALVPALDGSAGTLQVALWVDLDRDGRDEGVACRPPGPHRCWVLDFVGPELQLHEVLGTAPDGPLKAAALTARTGTWVRLQGAGGKEAILRDTGPDYVVESL